MKKLNNVLIFLSSLISACIFVKDLNIGAYDRLLSSASIILVLLIPRIVNKIFKAKLSDSLEFVYILFIILAQLLGSSLNFYNKIWWYDIFAHFLSGIFVTILALVVMKWFKGYDGKNKYFNILFILSFSLMVASLWEFLEFGADTILNMNVQHSIETGVKDTMEDMLVAFLGTLIVVISYLVEDKVRKNGFLKKVAKNIK